MADQRLPGLYDKVATFKERGIDLCWAPGAAWACRPDTPPEVVKYLRDAHAQDRGRPGLPRSDGQGNNLLPAYMDGEQFQAFMNSQSDYFKRPSG